MSQKNTLRFRKLVEPQVFRKFLVGLSSKTQFNFNHFGRITSRNVEAIVKKELIRNDKIKFFVFYKNEMIGYGFLTKFGKSMKKHNCILGIVLTDIWQRKGFGRTVCNFMIRYAWKHGFEKIWLNVHADNIDAFDLYRSLGFEIEGIFMNDEKIQHLKRHIVSMAIFKNRNFNSIKRIKLWKNLQKRKS